MTTPVVPIMTETFNYADNSPWPNEWTHTVASNFSGMTASVSSKNGVVTPPAHTLTASPAGDKIVMHASTWNSPTTIADFDLSVTLGTNSFYVSPGIWFCWDGSLSSANGYYLGMSKVNDEGRNEHTLQLYKVVNGVFTTIGSVSAESSTRPTRVRLRFSQALSTGRLEFRSWSPASAESGTWTAVADSTYTSGRIALGVWENGPDTGSGNITTSDYVTFTDFQLSLIGTATGAASKGAPTVAILTSDASSIDGTSFATASVTPTAGRDWFAFFTHVAQVGGTLTVSGAGLTWTLVDTINYAAGGRRLVVYRGTGTPTSGAITFSNSNAGNMTGGHWYIVEVTGGAGGAASTLPTANLATLVSSNNSLATTATLSVTQSPTSLPTVSPFATTIGCFAGALSSTTGQFSPVFPAGEVAELVTTNPNLNSCLITQVGDAMDTTVSVTQSGTVSCGGVAVVVQPAHQYPPLDGSSAATGIAG